MNILLAVGTVEQAKQPNYLAEGQMWGSNPIVTFPVQVLTVEHFGRVWLASGTARCAGQGPLVDYSHSEQDAALLSRHTWQACNQLLSPAMPIHSGSQSTVPLTAGKDRRMGGHVQSSTRAGRSLSFLCSNQGAHNYLRAPERGGSAVCCMEG
eukprot:1158707-Pelagomonas_calceolata.AAC.1